jgi:hypothetical protein
MNGQYILYKRKNKMTNETNKTHIVFKHMTDDNHMTILKKEAVKESNYIGYKYSHSTESTEVWVKDV